MDVETRRARQRRYYELNRERIIEARRRNYLENKERIAALRRSYYEANREVLLEKQRDYSRSYYQTHRDKWLLYAKVRRIRLHAES
jgi:hypothetical protein